MNINDLTVSWQDISDTERTALLNKPCPPRSKPKVHPPRKTPDRITSRVFSICQSAVMNNHTVQRPVRLNNLKSHTTLTSSKENIDDAYRTMIEFTETCKRESNNDGNPTEMPTPKRIRSSSPTSTLEQCASPSAISRYISHDSYLTFNPPPPTNATENSNPEGDPVDDALWDDWDMPSTVSKKAPGKIRTMSSPAVHSRLNPMSECQLSNQPEKEVSSIVIPSIVWDDDDDDFEQLLSQFPTEVPAEDSVSITTPPVDDENSTRLDASRRASACLTTENQSLLHNTTNIELSSQLNRASSLQRASTGPLSSPLVHRSPPRVNSPRVRCDSASAEKKKSACTAAEIEQKRLAALALRRQREQEKCLKK